MEHLISAATFLMAKMWLIIGKGYPLDDMQTLWLEVSTTGNNAKNIDQNVLQVRIDRNLLSIGGRLSR